MARRAKLTKEQKRIRKQTTARNPKTWIPYALIALVIVAVQIGSAIIDSRHIGSEVTFYRFQELAREGQVLSVEINVLGEVINFVYIEPETGEEIRATTWNPRTDASRNFIAGIDNLEVEVYTTTVFEAVSKVMATLPIMLLMIFLIIRLTLSVSKSLDETATALSMENLVSFNAIIGLDEVKNELQKIVLYLKSPEEAERAGARPVKGLILYGPPGVGKTMLAKAVAKESGLRFLTATGSDFNSMWAGVGGMKLKALFKLARHNSPCVLFIDEIEGLVAKRDFKGGGEVSRDNAKTLNVMLAEMDGLNTSNGVFVIGATNFLDVIDPAVLRGGRLERQVKVSHSGSLSETRSFTEFYLRPKFFPIESKIEKLGFWVKKIESDEVVEERELNADQVELVDVASILLQGRSPAEIESVINLAVYERLEEGVEELAVQHIDRALSKVITGGYPRAHEYEEDLGRSAAHEAGHALMGLLQGKQVLKATAFRHGDAGGFVLIAPPKYSFQTLDDIKDSIRFTLAGLEAEKILLGNASTGFANDMEKASELITLYVDRLGMGAEMVIRNKPESTLEKKDEILCSIREDVRSLLSVNKLILMDIAKLLKEKGTIYYKDLESLSSLREKGDV